jgi:hypothetical protein
VLGKGWENGERKRKDKMKKEMAHWKPASEAAKERNSCFMARLCAQEMHEDTATTSSSR